MNSPSEHESGKDEPTVYRPIPMPELRPGFESERMWQIGGWGYAVIAMILLLCAGAGHEVLTQMQKNGKATDTPRKVHPGDPRR